MSSHTWSGSRRRVLAAVAGVGMVAASLATASGASAAPPSTATAVELTDGSYVVIFREAPSTTYGGGLAGYAATKATNGKSFDHSRTQVQKYEAYLAAQQTKTLGAVGVQPLYSYTTALNAAAVQLTADQAARLLQDKNVLAVTPDEARTVDTVSSPAFLGLEGPNGNVWQQVGGFDKAGAGTVVGVIDTGYWPESPSFAGASLPTAKSVSLAAPGPAWSTAKSTGGAKTTLFYKADGAVFTGACQAGQEFAATTCNTKVISARFFDAGFSAIKNKDWSPAEYRSPRDGDGHGSHTASTAAGNHGVAMSIEGRSFGEGSGMAPGAKLAVYKVCWEDNDPGTGGCYTSDSIAAINQAVKDGVDVINYSISGATTTVVDAVEYAFYGAASAGVFVAASAGNSGPGASTVAHNSPWLTTVAASTHALYEGTVQLGAGGPLYKGASISDTGVPAQTRTVLSTAAGLAGVAAADVRLCAPGSLDPAVVTGAVVVCDRGVYDRVAKSAAVKAAGGVGMILANTTPGSLDADFHSVPTVHVDEVAGAAIKAYLAGGGTTTALLTGNRTGVPTPTPQIAGFSSRGPALANDSSLLKPDITAPGVSVIASVAPPSGGGRQFDLYSGTSMSSPHIAGLGALYLGVHPLWSPAAVKSAMMTTAYDLKKPDGSAATDPFAQGAGHVDPTRFFEPGLVLESGPADWAKFFTTQGLDLTGGVGLDPTDLNYPSIAVGQLAGARTITRTFTAVTPGTYTVAVAVPGFTVTPSATSLTFAAAGDTKTLDLTFTRSDAPLATWSTGFVTLTGPEVVRMPVALRPVSVAAPAEVSGTGASGSVDVTVTAGFTGTLQVSQAGLAEGAVQTGSLAPGETLEYIVDVAAGTSLARFDLDAGNDTADLDLYVYRMNAAGTALVALAGQSATGSADERVDLRNPVAGKYYVVAEGFANAAGESTTAFTQTDYLVTPATTLGALTVTPNPVPVTQGASSTFTVSWSGLDPAKPYLGWVGYDGALAPTVVSVN